MELVIYNITDGSILLTQNADEVKEYASITVAIPDGKQIVSVDVDTKEPVYEDRELTLEERLAALEASQEDQDDAIETLAETVGGEE